LKVFINTEGIKKIETFRKFTYMCVKS